MRGRRREGGSRNARSSLDAAEQAVLSAEAIVGRAWVEQLLRYHDRMEFALGAARETCQGASDRLAEEQRGGDPGRIGLAHAALEQALEAYRTIEAAGSRAREALHAALEVPAASAGDRHAQSTAAGRAQDSTRAHAPTLVAVSGLAPGRTGAGDAALQGVRRARRWIGRLLARRT